MEKYELTKLDVEAYKKYIQEGFDSLSKEDLEAMLKGSVLQTMLDAKAKDEHQDT